MEQKDVEISKIIQESIDRSRFNSSIHEKKIMDRMERTMKSNSKNLNVLIALMLAIICLAAAVVWKASNRSPEVQMIKSIDTGEAKANYDKMREAISFAAGTNIKAVNDHVDLKTDEILAKIDAIKPTTKIIYRDRYVKKWVKKKRHHK